MLNISRHDYTLIVANLLLMHYGMDITDVGLEDATVDAAIDHDERPYELVNLFVSSYDIERITTSLVTTDHTISAVEESAAIRLLNLSVSFDTPFRTYNQFLKQQYDACTCKNEYGSLKRFKADYIPSFGLNEWLVTLHGQTLTLMQTYRLVMAYRTVYQIKPSELPVLFRNLYLHHKIQFPVVYGLFTADYWLGFFERKQSQEITA